MEEQKISRKFRIIFAIIGGFTKTAFVWITSDGSFYETLIIHLILGLLLSVIDYFLWERAFMKLYLYFKEKLNWQD